MKKSFGMLLVFVLLAVLMALPASAEDYNPHPHTIFGHCVCNGLVEGHQCENVAEWIALEGEVNFGTLDSGYYYLVGDVTAVSVTDEFVGRVSKNDDGSYTCTQTTDLTICLNGYDITASGSRVFMGVTQGSSLTVTDCAYDPADTTRGGTVTGGSNSNGGIIYTYAKSEFSIYGGNFTAKEGVTVSNGGLIVIAQDRGDVAKSTAVEDQYSTFNLYNGHFYGGTAKNGGNFSFMHDVHVNIYGGLIEGGTATGSGGNIHSGGYVLLQIHGTADKPVVIRDGTAAANGGNVYMNHTTSTISLAAISNTTIYGGTATTAYGNLRIVGTPTLPGVTLDDCAPEVAAVWEGNKLIGQYTTLAAAVTAAGGSSSNYIQLLADVTETVTVSGDLYIDLSGHTLSGVTCTGTVYGMDSATNDYTDANAGSMTVTGTVAASYKTTTAQTGAIYRYLTVKDGSSYSFHRFYMGVTTVVLSPANDGMGYKATFAGSETVKAQLQDFGMGVSFDPLAESLSGNIYRTKSADKFTTGTPFTQKLIVKNILKKDIPENHDYASTPIYARCFIRLNDGTTLFSAQLGGNLMELVEAVDDNWKSYNTSQKNAVTDMLEQYPLSTGGWGITNAHHHDGQVWKAWTGTWEDGGHYYLTADYTLTTTISVPAGKSLTICLNGYRFEGTAARMFKVFGVLNIHDHREADGSYKGKLVSTYGTPVMAPVFYVYENGTMNVSGGNLTYEGSAVMTRGGIGMIGSNDQSDSNTTEDQAYFNMYYGNIYGGTVQATVVDGAVSSGNQGLGGNLDLVNHGVVTLYRGTVSGGTATYVAATGTNGLGGNICLSSSNTVLNLYSVDITDGSSGVHVISGTVNLYNDVNITGNTDYNLYISANKTVTANNLNGATVGVTTPGTEVFATVTNNAYADCFIADQPNVWVVNTDGSLNICHGHCVCGNCAEGVGDHSCAGLTYTAIPTGTVNLGTLKTGNYYLTGDITVTGVTNFSNKDVKICLNGYSITPGDAVDAPLGRVRSGAELHISDCSGEKDGSGNWSFDGSIYAGTRTYGGVTNVNANGKLYIYGGNFIGTTGNTSGGVFNICNDGHGGDEGDQYLDVYDTQLNMYNGHIQGGSVTKDGGAINCWHHVKVNIYGGSITGGTAGEEGGNICVSGIWNIENAVISGGTATTEGGNIYIPGSAEVHITDSALTDGTAGDDGGNIAMRSDSHLYLDDASITGGTAPMGGGVFNYMATVHVAGNTVINNNTGYNLHQFLAKAVDVGTLGSSAKIGVYSEVKGKLLNTTSYTSRFFSEDSNYSLITFNGNTMYLATGTTLSYTTPTTFSAGFGEVDASPTENGVPLGGYGTSSTRLSTEVDANGRLYTMTTAITDKNGTTVLIVACDQIRFTDTITSTIREHMSAATGVPVENIYINCSHTHSTPEPGSTTPEALRYRVLMFNSFVESGILAMKDRKAATMQTGSFDVEGPNGTLNFIRHYQYTTADGVVKYFGDNFGTAVYDSTTKPVDEVDPTMHLVRFVRSGTDILLCNWRAHPHFTGGSAKTLVSSDYVGPFRDQAESLLGDVEVVFIQGAAGNVNEKSRLSSLNHGYTGDTAYITYGKALAQELKDNIGVLKTVSTGTIQTKQVKFIATVDHETDVLIEQAREVNETYWDLDTDARKALLAKYGFSSVYHAGAIAARFSMSETKEVEINIFSIGKQVGFYTVPGELWCSASEEIEAASPFPTTFCIGYSLGDYKYFTYGTAWNYESYETANYRLTVPDTIYTMLSYWKAGLKELYNN